MTSAKAFLWNTMFCRYAADSADAGELGIVLRCRAHGLERARGDLPAPGAFLEDHHRLVGDDVRGEHGVAHASFGRAGDAALQAEAEIAKAELKTIGRPAGAVPLLRTDSVLRAGIAG